MVLVPHISHGGVAIADMQRPGRHEYPFHGSGIRGYDQVVASQVQLLHGHRIEREKMPVKSVRPWNSAQERLRNVAVPKARGNRSGIGNKRKDVRFRKHGCQRFKHTLTAALRDQPVMNDSHAHVSPTS